MKISGILIGLLLATVVNAQGIDESRMERDIKVAEDIISSLMNPSDNDRHWGSISVNGNYIPNYGVIFNIPANESNWPLGIKLWDGEDGHIVIGNRIKLSDDDGHSLISGLVDNFENYQEVQEDHLEVMMVAFLVDYADLIGQLKPSDKIMIKSEQRLNNIFVLGSAGSYNFKAEGFEHNAEDDYDQEGYNGCCDGDGDYILSAEVMKSDLTAYRSGQLDREELIDKITIDKSKASGEKEPELELLSSIFHRLYKADLSETYFATSAPRYNRIANFGVIYDWKVYASNIDNGKHNMPTIDSYGLSVEERNTQVEQLYPVFVQQFKQQLIEYGRTLKGLDQDEILMFKIRLTQCKGCSIPATITASVKRSVLNDFERQKINLSEAAKRITITEKKVD